MSNCQECTFLVEGVCAINPSYAKAVRGVQRLEKSEQAVLMELLEGCPDFNYSPLLTLTLTLTEKEWEHICRDYERFELDSIFQRFITQVEKTWGRTINRTDPMPY